MKEKPERPGRPAPAPRWRSGGRLLLAVACAILLYLNFDAEALDSEGHQAHAKTPDQMYTPVYPDDGKASFGVIYAANGPFVARAFRSAAALGAGANATIFSDAAGARACAALRRAERHRFADKLGGLECRVANATNTWGFRAAKLWAFTAAPYDKALYLDADAFPCASFAWLRKELSPALERYDILATHSSMRRGFPHARPRRVESSRVRRERVVAARRHADTPRDDGRFVERGVVAAPPRGSAAPTAARRRSTG